MSSAESEKSKMRAFLDDPLAVGGLGQDDQVALQAPAQEDLGRRGPAPPGDLAAAPVAEMAAGAQRAVGLERDPALLATPVAGAGGTRTG
jgi:hypothetical protein